MQRIEPLTDFQNRFDAFSMVGCSKGFVDLLKGVEPNKPIKREHSLAIIVQQLRNEQLGNGIALYDTATTVRRLQDNASDKFLEIVEPTDVRQLLKQLPLCRAIVTTGQKATDTLRAELGIEEEPPVGGKTAFQTDGRSLWLYRMPSSSRAYPLALEKKAAIYQLMFSDLRLIKKENT